jgi:hypothetical protein
MKPTVQILGIPLPGKKKVLTSWPAEAVENVDIRIPIEKYFGHPTNNSFDQLTYLEYQSRYSIVDHPTFADIHPDVCDPVRFANLRKEPMLCIINSVHPRNHELFASRLLVRRFPTRPWEEPLRLNNEICQNLYGAVKQLGLIANQDHEAEICLQDAFDLNRPPSDIRFILAQMVCHGASREVLEA